MNLTRLPTIDKRFEPWTPGPHAFVDLSEVQSIKPKTLGLRDHQLQTCSTLVMRGGNEIDLFDTPDALARAIEVHAPDDRDFDEMARMAGRAPFNES